MKHDSFGRYSGWIQDYIYQKNWTELREIQEVSTSAIMDTEDHVLISSDTASGKTEAAFLPALTLLDENPSSTVGILYISPLKALINDQHKRLNELLRRGNIPVFAWHGDISRSKKQAVRKVNQGIVQMTPESLEAMLMRNPHEAKELFSDTRFVIIDEIHAFLGSDRGLQLQNLLVRLERICGSSYRRIALSATLSNPEPVLDFLASQTGRKAILCRPSLSKRKVSMYLESFEIPEDEEGRQKAEDEWHAFLYDQLQNQKAIVFCNSRAQTEQVCQALKKIAAKRKEKDRFLVHHGSVSAALREKAELQMKNSEKVVICATVTLELGIDVGDLDLVVEIEAPWKVSSLVQRLGRSGRISRVSRMLMISLHHESSASLPYFLLPWDLLQHTAMVEIYRRYKWVENEEFLKKPYSLLAHQTLSVLQTYHQLKPNQLAGFVLSLPAFKDRFSADEYRVLLRSMLEKRFLEKDDEGNLFVGLNAEREVSNWKFFAVFKGESEWRAIFQGQEIGQLSLSPQSGMTFTLAGRNWVIDQIFEDRKVLNVSPDNSGEPPEWDGAAGQIDKKVTRMIFQILKENEDYPYLSENSRILLQKARKLAQENGITESPNILAYRNLFFLNGQLSEKNLKSLKNLLWVSMRKEMQIKKIFQNRYYIGILSDLPALDVLEKIRAPLSEKLEASRFVNSLRRLQIQPYDRFVPDNLLAIAFIEDHVELSEVKKFLDQISGGEDRSHKRPLIADELSNADFWDKDDISC